MRRRAPLALRIRNVPDGTTTPVLDEREGLVERVVRQVQRDDQLAWCGITLRKIGRSKAMFRDRGTLGWSLEADVVARSVTADQCSGALLTSMIARYRAVTMAKLPGCAFVDIVALERLQTPRSEPSWRFARTSLRVDWRS